MVHYLKSHPTKQGYLVEDYGEPISSKHYHTFRFAFNKIHYSETLSFRRPIIRGSEERGTLFPELGEIEKNEHNNLRIEMVPYWKNEAYSYIGSQSIIKSFINFF